MSKIVVLSILMMLVTAPSRILPAFLLSERKLSPFIESFLHYVPYAILGSLIFPDILYSAGNIYSSISGAIIAALLAWFGKSTLTVLMGAIAAAFIISNFAAFM